MSLDYHCSHYDLFWNRPIRNEYLIYCLVLDLECLDSGTTILPEGLILTHGITPGPHAVGVYVLHTSSN